MKSLVINTPEGRFYINFLTLAEYKADYFACEKGGYERGSKEWANEVIYGINDQQETLNWFRSYNWDKWVPKLTKLSSKIKTNDINFWNDENNFEILDLKL